jgi:WD40 repeat protein
MIKHRSPVSGIHAFGRSLIATAGYDNQVLLWDAVRKRVIAKGTHDHLANQCSFSACGRRLVSASSDYTARLWSVPGMRILTVLVGHDDDVEMAVISPDGARVATASRDHTIGVFCAAGGTMERRLTGHTADVISVAWAAGGSELISSSDDGTIRRWSPLSGEMLDVIDLDGTETDTIAVGDDGSIYAGNDRGELVLLRDRRVQRFAAHRAGIKRVLYEPARKLVLTASYDRTVKIWNVAGEEPTLSSEAEAPAGVWLRAVAFAGSDTAVFGTFGSSYATLSLPTGEWDLTGVEDTGGLNAVRVAGGAVYSIGDAGVVFRDGVPTVRIGSLCNFIGVAGTAIVTGGQSGTLFNARTGEPIHSHSSPLNCSTAFDRSGQRHLVVGTYTGEGLVFKEAGGSLSYVATIAMHDNAVKGVAANAGHLFSVCATGAARLFSIDTLECVGSYPNAHRKISNGAAVLPNGAFASVSRDLALRIWRGETWEEIATPHTHSVKCVAASPGQGSLIATGSYSGEVALFDWRRRQWVFHECVTSSGISSLCPAEQEDVFWASSYDGHVYEISAGGR